MATWKTNTEKEQEITDKLNNARKPTNQQLEKQLLYDKQKGKCITCKQDLDIEKSHIHIIHQPTREGTHSLSFMELVCTNCINR